MSKDDTAAIVDALTKQFVDEGRLIEAGWQAMRVLVIPASASSIQLSEMRKAYFSGAQHLFASLMGVVGDDGGAPTADELRRVDLISDELDKFVAELRAEIEQR